MIRYFKLFLIPMILFAPLFANAEEAFDLGEVVVTTEKEAVAKATTVNEITAEDIKARGCKTVADALELIPGVDVEMGGKGEMHVYIRGFKQENVKVLIDGVPAYETYFRTLDLSQFPVESIAKIKVIKGASSVLYGANTMGGVINIITKKGSSRPAASAKVAFGDYGTQHYALNHGWQIGNINYFFTYTYQKSDGFRLSSHFNPNDANVGVNSSYHEDGGKRDLSDYKRHAFNAKVGYDKENTKVYLSFDYHNNKRGIPTEFNRYWRFTDWDQWHLNLVGEQKFGDNLKLKARAFYVDHEDTIASYTDKTCTSLGGRWFDKSAYDDYSAGGEVQAHLKTGNFNLLKFGFNYIFDQHKQQEYNPRNKKGKVTYSGWASEETYETATYTFAIEDEIYFGLWSMIAGLSYDRFHPIKSAGTPPGDDIDTVNPQIGIVYILNQTTKFHTSLGKKTRFPHMRELYSQRDGNPDLKPQRTLAFEIGVDKYFEWSGLNGSFSVAYFYNRIRDLIERVDLPSGDRQYQNIGRARIQGVEASLQLMPIDHLWTELNYTYLWTKDDEKARPLEENPEDKICLDVRYEFEFGLSISTQATYVHRQYTYIYHKRTKTEAARILPDYFLLNAKITQKVMKHWLFFAQVENLTDVDYDEGNGPMPGRNFLIGAEARW